MPYVITIREAAARAKCDENQIVEYIDEGLIETLEVKGKKTKMILGKSLNKCINRLWWRDQHKKMAECGIENMNIDKCFN